MLSRERDGGAYGTNAYFVAMLLFDLVPMRVLPPTFFAIFSYWSIGLHTKCVTCVITFTGSLLHTKFYLAFCTY